MNEILNSLDENPESVMPDDILRSIESIDIDLHGRRNAPVNFLRTPKLSEKERELSLRSRLAWLRTIPLSGNEAFVVLHEESGVYMQGADGRQQKRKAGLCSADLLGLHYIETGTTQFAVAELKYGEKSNNLIYAYAEGLRNLFLHLQGYSRIADGWTRSTGQNSAWAYREKNAWSQKTTNGWRLDNPFEHKVEKNAASLFIIGDYNWTNKAKNSKTCPNKDLICLIPKAVCLNKKWRINVAVYSTCKDSKSTSAPCGLLPLTKLK